MFVHLQHFAAPILESERLSFGRCRLLVDVHTLIAAVFLVELELPRITVKLHILVASLVE